MIVLLSPAEPQSHSIIVVRIIFVLNWNRMIIRRGIAGVHVVSLPLYNRFLRVAGDSIRTSFKRGMTLAHEFLEREIAFACASDKIHDVSYAYGDFNILEVCHESAQSYS